MKNCPNCGKEVAESDVFCGNCGSNLKQNNSATNVNVTINNQNFAGNNSYIQNRNIAMAIILSIITCGIYYIYWFIVMTDDANRATNENDTSGAMAFVFSLITCGIYSLYWYYKMGQKLHRAGQAKGLDIADNGILYLILGLLGFGVVSYALIQNDLNKLAN